MYFLAFCTSVLVCFLTFKWSFYSLCNFHSLIIFCWLQKKFPIFYFKVFVNCDVTAFAFVCLL
jgi:hypothetical protein